MKVSTSFFLVLLSSCLLACNGKKPRELVVGKIHALSELGTAQINLSKIVIGQVDKKGLFGLRKGRKSRIVVVHTEAIVKAGVDLSKLQEDDLEISESMVSIRLPPVEVLNFNFPSERFRLDRELSSEKDLRKLRPADFDVILQKAESDIRERINHLGLEKTIEERTRLVLETLMRKIGYQEVYISFQPNEQLVFSVPAPKAATDPNALPTTE